MTKKVLYYISYPQRMAGSQRQIINLIENLPNSIHPIVLLPFEGEVGKYLKKKGIKVKIIEPIGLMGSYGQKILKNSWILNFISGISGYIKYNYLVLKYIKSEKVNLIHCAEPRSAVTIGLAGRLSGKNTISHIQGELPYNNYFLKLFEILPNKIITNAKFVFNYLKPKVQKKAITVYSGISKPVENNNTKSAWLEKIKENGVLIISCFASVVPFKGYHHLIEAIRIVNSELGKEASSKVLFLGVGDLVKAYPDYQNWLYEKLQKYNINNFTFTGWQNDPFYFLNSSDLTTLASVSQEELSFNGRTIQVAGNEGFPTTHLEAMMLKKPIVGTSIAGVPEQISDKKTGFVVPPSDFEQLAESLLKLIKDENLRKQMGEAAFNKVQKYFSVESYVKNVVNIYNSLY